MLFRSIKSPQNQHSLSPQASQHFFVSLLHKTHWLDLIYQSIHNPQRPVLNTENVGIKKAVELISFENLTPQERTQAK